MNLSVYSINLTYWNITTNSLLTLSTVGSKKLRARIRKTAYKCIHNQRFLHKFHYSISNAERIRPQFPWKSIQLLYTGNTGSWNSKERLQLHTYFPSVYPHGSFQLYLMVLLLYTGGLDPAQKTLTTKFLENMWSRHSVCMSCMKFWEHSINQAQCKLIIINLYTI